MDLGESQLVARARAGDQAACRLLYREHAGRTAAYLRRCGFASPDVEDLVQETFVRVFRSLGTFDAARGGLGPWLGAIARNVARRRWHRCAPPDSLDPDLAEAVFEAPAEDAAGETREQLEALRGCLEALPPDLDRIVRLRYVEARSTRGIAQAERLPEATVRLRLDEARETLARCLKAKGVRP